MKRIKVRKERLKRVGNFKKILIIIGLIVIFSFSIVKAGIQDSKMLKNRVEGVYAIARINGEDRIRYLNMYTVNDRISYCIELGVDILTDIYNSTDDFSLSSLSKEEIDYIRLISYYGYGYKEHTDYKYYLASQELIWEYLGSSDIYWVKEMKVDGERIDIDNYKTDIINLINEDKKEINIEIGQAYQVGSEIILEDKAGVLNQYEVVETKYSEAKIEDNKLIIKVGNELGTEEIKLKKKGWYSYESSLYYYDNSQKLISNGNYENTYKDISFEIKGVSLNAKILEGIVNNVNPVFDSLKDAKYLVTDETGEIVGEYLTNYAGKLTIDNLRLGKYFFKQLEPSKGYKVNEEIMEVEVVEDGQEFILKQDLITNTIVINKVYGSNGSYKAERDAVFSFFDESSLGVMLWKTNSKGVIKVEVPYGRYKVSQISGIAGHKISESFYIDIVEEKEEEVVYNLVNELILVDLQINTYLNDNEELVDGYRVGYKVKDTKNNTYIEYNGEYIFYADNDGILRMPVALKYGSYSIEQVDISEELVLNNNTVDILINNRTKLELIDGKMVLKISFYNDLVKGSINVSSLKEVYYKDYNEYGYKLENSYREEVELRASEDIVVNNKALYKEGEKVYEGIIPDNNNLIIDNLYLGKYIIKNKNTLEEKDLVLDYKNKVIDIEFIKYLDKFNLNIKNIGSDKDIIKDSLFEVIDKDEDIIYTGISNDKGEVLVNNIIEGKYCIRQKQVNEKYNLIKDDYCLVLNDNKDIELINEKIINKIIEIPNTLSIKDIGIYEILSLSILLGVLYVVYKKIFCSKLYR